MGWKDKTRQASVPHHQPDHRPDETVPEPADWQKQAMEKRKNSQQPLGAGIGERKGTHQAADLEKGRKKEAKRQKN